MFVKWIRKCKINYIYILNSFRCNVYLNKCKFRRSLWECHWRHVCVVSTSCATSQSSSAHVLWQINSFYRCQNSPTTSGDFQHITCHQANEMSQPWRSSRGKDLTKHCSAFGDKTWCCWRLTSCWRCVSGTFCPAVKGDLKFHLVFNSMQIVTFLCNISRRYKTPTLTLRYYVVSQ